MRVKFFLLFL